MKKYYTVKNNTKAYEALERAYNAPKQWFREDVKADIVSLIGFDYKDSFVCSTTSLLLDEDKVSDDIRNQFSKKAENISGSKMLRAKKGSKIQKDYMDICKKYELDNYTTQDFQYDFLIGESFSISRFEDGVWVLEFNPRREYDFLNEITEKEYLQTKISNL